MKLNRIVVIIVFILISKSSFAQQNTEHKNVILDTTSISYAQQIVFHSKILNEDRGINIYLPKSFYTSSAKQTYPLIMLYGAHGNQFFLTTSGIVEHLSGVHRMPEAIVICFNNAITYAPDIYANGMWGPNMEMLTSNADPNKFVKHLKEELFPYFKKNYKTADFRMIVGVSGSSIFPMHTFAKNPELFQAHIILAGVDMIGMGYEPNKTFIDAFENRLNTTVGNSYLYFGVAEGDLSWEEIYTKNLEDFKRQIEPFTAKGLKLKVEVIPNEIHYDSYIKGVLTAFELIFPKQTWATEYVDLINKPGNALQNIKVFHAELSSQYGFNSLPKIERWNDQNSFDKIGHRLIRNERIQEAVEVFYYITENRPNSDEAYYNLAKALEINKQFDKALIAFKKAYTISKKSQSKESGKYLEQVHRLEKTKKH